MKTPDLVLCSNSTDTDRLEVRFVKIADRWGHEIWLVSEAPSETSKIRLLATVEGTDRQAWPPSPPIQDLDEHVLGLNQSAILGVGMAGLGHWSASIARRENQTEFEMACLTKTDEGFLGSTYLILPDDPQAKLDEVLSIEKDRWTLKIDDLTIEIGTVAGTRRAQFSRCDRQLVITPATISTKPGTATQWSYPIRMVNEPDRLR